MTFEDHIGIGARDLLEICLRIQMLVNYDDCLKLRKMEKCTKDFRLYYVMLLLYFSSNVQCFCVPANTVQTSL